MLLFRFTEWTFCILLVLAALFKDVKAGSIFRWKSGKFKLDYVGMATIFSTILIALCETFHIMLADL